MNYFSCSPVRLKNILLMKMVSTWQSFGSWSHDCWTTGIAAAISIKGKSDFNNSKLLNFQVGDACKFEPTVKCFEVFVSDVNAQGECLFCVPRLDAENARFDLGLTWCEWFSCQSRLGFIDN